MNGTTNKDYPRFYLVENRVYSGYDTTLQTGPYNFGWADTKPDWVERFPYQNGMLVWYVDGSYADNNTSTHPGGGQALPVDARPAPVKFPTGQLLGNRRQPWDATFGQEKTDQVTFHRNGVPVTIKQAGRDPDLRRHRPQQVLDRGQPVELGQGRRSRHEDHRGQDLQEGHGDGAQDHGSHREVSLI